MLILNILIKLKSFYYFRNCRHHVHPLGHVISPEKITGNGKLTVAKGCVVNASGGLILNSDLHLSQNAHVYTVGFDSLKFHAHGLKRHSKRAVIVSAEVWVAAGGIIAPGQEFTERTIVCPVMQRVVHGV